MGHNPPAYLHAVTEALRFAAADREAYFGDRDFLDAPLDIRLSRPYSAASRALVDPHGAWSEMPPAGGAGACRRAAAPAEVSRGLGLRDFIRDENGYESDRCRPRRTAYAVG